MRTKHRAAIMVATTALVVTILAPASGASTPSVSLSRRVGPPTATIQVSGAGFGSNETVDLYFDTTNVALASTDNSGSFGPIRFHVSPTAQPGVHWITASGRSSGLSAQQRFRVRTDWPTFHMTDSREGFNRLENTVNTSNVADLQLDWSVPVPSSSVPAVTRGVVYVDTDRFEALKASTGAPIWRFRRTAVAGYSASAAVANGVVYVGSLKSRVFALDASTGSLIWSFVAGRYVFLESSPAVAYGLVFIGASNDKVYALDASTGTIAWSYTTGDSIYTSPAVADGVVYIGSNDRMLYALDAHTGALRWSYQTPGTIYSTPAVVNGVVFVGGGRTILALNAKTGEFLWSYDTGSLVASSPAVAHGVVYEGSDSKSVYALDASTGALLWTFATGGYVVSSPTVANGVVYVGSNDKNMYALDAATGQRLWMYRTSGAVFSPVIVNGAAYFGVTEISESPTGAFYAFHLPRSVAAPARPNPDTLQPSTQP